MDWTQSFLRRLIATPNSKLDVNSFCLENMRHDFDLDAIIPKTFLIFNDLKRMICDRMPNLLERALYLSFYSSF